MKGNLHQAKKTLLDANNDVFASAASAWEIAIKHSLGKIELPGPPETWLPEAVVSSGFDWIEITPEDALRVASLPWRHRDPFDRMLIAQTFRGFTLATSDERVIAYGVPTLRS